MAYLVGIDAQTSEVLMAVRFPLRSWTYGEARIHLERRFPDGKIMTPLEKIPGDTFRDGRVLLVTLYVSRNKSGEGRIVCPFQQWAVVFQTPQEKDEALSQGKNHG